MTKQWADEILAVKPELEKLVGGPVHLEPFNWFFSIGCRVDGRKGAVRIDKVKYKDPRDGLWHVLDASFDTEAGLDLKDMETVRVSADEAKQLLTEYVRGAAAQ